jgi:hypothetical protein
MYTLYDAKKSALGAFVGALFFLAVRAGEPININPFVGLGITLFLLWVTYNGFYMRYKMFHFIGNIVITTFVVSLLAILFELVTFSQLFSFSIFGSTVIVAFWISLPIAFLFDRRGLNNPMDRFYVRRQR